MLIRNSYQYPLNVTVAREPKTRKIFLDGIDGNGLCLTPSQAKRLAAALLKEVELLARRRK